MEANADQIRSVGESLVNGYYSLLTTNRQELAAQYTENGSLSYEGKAVYGQAKISEKLESLPTDVLRKFETLDVQLIPGSNILIASVVGHVAMADSPMKISFTETFVFLPKTQDASQFAISNSIFRLVYPAA